MVLGDEGTLLRIFNIPASIWGLDLARIPLNHCSDTQRGSALILPFGNNQMRQCELLIGTAGLFNRLGPSTLTHLRSTSSLSPGPLSCLTDWKELLAQRASHFCYHTARAPLCGAVRPPDSFPLGDDHFTLLCSAWHILVLRRADTLCRAFASLDGAPALTLSDVASQFPQGDPCEAGRATQTPLQGQPAAPNTVFYFRLFQFHFLNVLFKPL